ncbi:hypothetical protein ACFL6U_17540 [Planctomycetota bacterium]
MDLHSVNSIAIVRVSLYALLGMLLVCVPLQAQSPSPPNVDNLYHWAYGAIFGNGVYTVGGDRVLVLRITPQFELAGWQKERVTLNLKLPFTVGIQDVDLGEFSSLDLDSILQTASFVPGLDLVTYPVEAWRLKPFGHLGGGIEMGGSESAWIYYGGVNSRYTFDLDTFDMDLLNGIHWAGYNPNQGNSDRFSRLITGLEWEIPLGNTLLAGEPAILRPHVAHFWYFDQLGFKQIEQSAMELKQEWELGLAIGKEERMSLGFFHFDRIGLAYRVSDDLQGIRLYFGSIMD